MRTTYRKIATGMLALSASTLALSSAAHAQIDEIITTAQKRSENLQDVPVAITAFDVEALEKNRIEGLEDIGTFTSGLYVTQNPADPNGVRINIRGIGTFDPQIGQDSRVAIYQDGIYLGKTQGLVFDMPDLAQIDVLKGPQGTLYGRNTVAGAVNLVSAKPDYEEFSGKATVEYGNFNHKKVAGAINIPLGGAAGARLSGVFLDRDGWVENNGPGVDFGGENKIGLRGAVAFDVGDSLQVQFAADYNEVEKEPLFYQSFGPGAAPFAAAISTFDDGRQEDVTTSFTNETGNLETKGVSATVDWNVADNHDVKFTAGYREVDSTRFVTLIPTANPGILSQITGGFNQALAPLPFAFGAVGSRLRPDFAAAFDGDPPPRGLFLSTPGGAPTLQGHNQLSLEATYTGESANGRLEYTAGLFYYDEETGTGPVINNNTNANDYLFVLSTFSPALTAGIDQGLAANGAPFTINGFLDTIDLAPQFPGIQSLPAGSRGPVPVMGVLLGQLRNPDPAVRGTAQAILGILAGTVGPALGGARQSASNTLSIDTTAFAAYGQATWHLTDDFRITAGLRFSDESKDGQQQTFSPFFIDTTDLLGNPILPNISSFDDSVLDPSLTLEYDATEDLLLYASYKESFRSGGFNQAAVGLRLPGETFGPDFNFGLESITAYEAGFKGEFGDRIRLNGAAYYYDFTDKQTTFSLNPLIATERAIVNADDEIYGFDIDGQFAVTDEITFSGSYSYVDGDAGDTVNPNNPADIRMFSELQGTPKSSYLLSANYDGRNGLFGNISFSHKGEVLLIPESDVRLPSFNLVNGRIGYDFELSNGNEATIALWGTNLLDEEYLIDELPFDTFAHQVKVFGQPRSYGASIGVKF